MKHAVHACPTCRIPHADFVARAVWPDAADVTRCADCGAVTSYRWPIDTGSGLPVFERRRIAP